MNLVFERPMAAQTDGRRARTRTKAARLLAAVAVGWSCSVLAQAAADVPSGHTPTTLVSAEAAQPGPAAPAVQALPEVAAEVRRIQADQGKLTLRHAPIPNLDMAAMTMVFRVADPAWLAGLKVGDSLMVTVGQGPQGLTVQSLRRQP